jgi:Spy/CpxP family protein refolding chaperone
MRNLTTAVLGAALLLAIFSAIFMASTYHTDSAWAHQACTLGGAFCQRPLLLLIPTGVTLVWGFLLKAAD